MFAPLSFPPSVSRSSKSPRAIAAMLVAAAMAGCAAPVRFGPTNPYVLSDSIPTDPSGDQGYAYHHPSAARHRVTVTTLEEKRIIPFER